MYRALHICAIQIGALQHVPLHVSLPEAHATEVYIPKVCGKLGAGQIRGRQVAVAQVVLRQMKEFQGKWSRFLP